LLELVLRIAFSLLVVLGLMWGLAKVARRPLVGRGAGAIAVLGRQQLSRAASLAVVRVGDRALILGVTDAQVSLLGETEVEAMQRSYDEPTERRDPVTLEPLSLGPASSDPDPSTPPTGAVPDAEADAPAPARTGALDGSLLSPRTWVRTVEFLRDRTARR
jgi:flagellar protein FliO/FliZ